MRRPCQSRYGQLRRRPQRVLQLLQPGLLQRGDFDDFAAETFLEARYPMARVLTAWPASAEISQPSLGYVTRSMRVLQIENFTVEEMISAADLRSKFDVALVFSTKYDPRHSMLGNWRAWQRIKAEYFDYHRDVPPAAAAQLLGGRLVYADGRNGQWVGVIEMGRLVEARSNRVVVKPPQTGN